MKGTSNSKLCHFTEVMCYVAFVRRLTVSVNLVEYCNLRRRIYS